MEALLDDTDVHFQLTSPRQAHLTLLSSYTSAYCTLTLIGGRVLMKAEFNAAEVPPEARSIVGRYLVNVNFGLQYGNFVFDYDRGLVWYRMTVPVTMVPKVTIHHTIDRFKAACRTFVSNLMKGVELLIQDPSIDIIQLQKTLEELG